MRSIFILAALAVFLGLPVYGSISSTPAPVDDPFSAPKNTTTVPEAPTILAGSLLVLPFGLCALKSLRKNRD